MLTGIISASDLKTISHLEINISGNTTSIILNVNSDFTIRKTTNANTLEVLLPGCKVNLLGSDHALIPSFSPLIDLVEIQPNENPVGAIIRLKFSDNYEKPVMTFNYSNNNLVFNFTANRKAISKVQPLSQIVLPEPPPPVVPIGEPLDLIPKTYIEPSIELALKSDLMDPSGSKPVEVAQPVPVEVTENETIESESQETTQPTKVIKIPSSDSIPPTEKPVVFQNPENSTQNVENTIDSTKEKEHVDTPIQSVLESLYYSQGMEGSDIVTLEFKDNSPKFIKNTDSSGRITITFSNLVLPEEIFTKDKLWREINGSAVKAIQLHKFIKDDLPAFELSFKVAGKVTVEIEDMGGIIEIRFSKEKN
jgi:hypothetical protein